MLTTIKSDNKEPFKIAQQIMNTTGNKTNVENKIDFNHTKSPEFDFWKWVSYWYPIRQVVVFKRDVYRKVLKEFMVSALPRNITPNGKLKGCTRSNGDSRTRRKFC
jgi:putative (di)nucleoside polyphosphate hydrolase